MSRSGFDPGATCALKFIALFTKINLINKLPSFDYLRGSERIQRNPFLPQSFNNIYDMLLRMIISTIGKKLVHEIL